MSADTDLEILKNFVMDDDPKIERDSLILEPDNEVVALDDAELMAPIEDVPVNVVNEVDDIEALRMRLQTAEIAAAEAIARAEAAEKVAVELGDFRHEVFTKLRTHIKAGGGLYQYPLNISPAAREAIRNAADVILEIARRAAAEKYVPIFEIKITDISTQKRPR